MKNGRFIHFPGIVEDERWNKERRVKIFEDVRYEAQFVPVDHQYLILWLMQPDGMYWMDEFGFGIEDDQSIMFYSILDENGKFLKPFELFEIGETRYCHDYNECLK